MSPVSYINAGLLSFLGNIFSKSTSAEIAIVHQSPINNPNAGLLHAVVNVNPKLAYGGGDITIVNSSALLADIGVSGASLGDSEPSYTGDQLSIYVVRNGDTLSQIAEMFDVSVNTIRWANDIPRGVAIHEGDTLVILPVSGVKHTIAKGETLASIAKKYSGDVDEIINFNNLNEDLISVGTNIIVPNGAVALPAPVKRITTTTQRQNGPSYSGYYLRPVNGVLSQGIHGYNAIDLASPSGTSVLASASGDVVVSKFRTGNPWFGGYGNYIVISHDNGTQTLYAHLSKVSVSEGWRVVKGQIIGAVGSTGRSTGPHLHFEVRGAQNPFR